MAYRLESTIITVAYELQLKLLIKIIHNLAFILQLRMRLVSDESELETIYFKIGLTRKLKI